MSEAIENNKSINRYFSGKDQSHIRTVKIKAIDVIGNTVSFRKDVIDKANKGDLVSKESLGVLALATRDCFSALQ